MANVDNMINIYRGRCGMTQRELAQKLSERLDRKYTRPEISNIERGRTMPTASELDTIADILGTIPKKLYEQDVLKLVYRERPEHDAG